MTDTPAEPTTPTHEEIERANRRAREIVGLSERPMTDTPAPTTPTDRIMRLRTTLARIADGRGPAWRMAEEALRQDDPLDEADYLATLATRATPAETLDVERLGLSDEQTRNLRQHLIARQQTLGEWISDVLFDMRMGRPDGIDYPPAAVRPFKSIEAIPPVSGDYPTLANALRRLYTKGNYLGHRAEDDATAILAEIYARLPPRNEDTDDD